MTLTITLHAKNVFIFFLWEGRIFRVHIFHYISDFFGVQTSVVLEPNYSTMYSAEITIGSNFSCYLFQELTLIFLISFVMNACCELVGKQFFFTVFSCFKDMCIGFWLECEVGIMSIDNAQTAQEKMKFHNPESVMTEIFSDCIGR